MAKVISDRSFQTEERNEALFKEYQRVIEGYGDTARYVAKAKLYEKAAKPFFISTGRAKNITNEMMRKKTSVRHVRG